MTNAHRQHNLTAVVAIDRNRGIGKDNQLVWHLPEDLAHFKKITLEKPIIMGRKTFLSIGRPLPMRPNIVLTREKELAYPGVIMANSVEQALNLVGDKPACVIGGADIFAKMMPFVKRLIITEIDGVFECDTFFPEISALDWKVVARTGHYSEKANLRYAIATFERI